MKKNYVLKIIISHDNEILKKKTKIIQLRNPFCYFMTFHITYFCPVRPSLHRTCHLPWLQITWFAYKGTEFSGVLRRNVRSKETFEEQET